MDNAAFDGNGEVAVRAGAGRVRADDAGAAAVLGAPGGHRRRRDARRRGAAAALQARPVQVHDLGAGRRQAHRHATQPLAPPQDRAPGGHRGGARRLGPRLPPAAVLQGPGVGRGRREDIGDLNSPGGSP
ncbi:hypothetical protein ONE63_001173 [Megalurothrips usitatus]|uniref:Uncharacterized protein n=1 Tax=Megalurothrips usitatus TaxID=439358 RepID=A0AAV7XB83_9NEOP|nr:hypothetical protein ONE63_001173 [Megalurothrips usitatus]